MLARCDVPSTNPELGRSSQRGLFKVNLDHTRLYCMKGEISVELAACELYIHSAVGFLLMEPDVPLSNPRRLTGSPG